MSGQSTNYWSFPTILSQQEEAVSFSVVFFDRRVGIIMGCDGGSIPRRDEMVKLKKKAEKVR